MTIELSSKMKEEGFLVDWAERVQYGLELSDDHKETSETVLILSFFPSIYLML